MATYTTKLALKKPAGTDPVLIADINTNMDTLDHAQLQYSTMPTAAIGNLGWIVTFTGTTDASYTHGHVYECVSSGGGSPTYSWASISSVEVSGSWTPTVTAAVGTLTTYSIQAANYYTIGKLVFVSIAVTTADIGTGTIALVISLPFAAKSVTILLGREDAVGGFLLQGVASGSSVSVYKSDNSTPMVNNGLYRLGGCYLRA